MAPDHVRLLRWGIVGVGQAGRARALALRQDPRAELVGGYGGRPEDEDLPRFDSLDALLEAVDAVAICSPDPLHPEQVRAALAAGCHAVCEFPLARDGATARALFEEARARESVLHVEHIELLGPQADWLRERCTGRALLRGRLAFRRAVTHGSLPHDNLARFHRLWDAVGRPEPDPPHLRVGEAPVVLDLRYAPGLPRHLELELELDDGHVLLQRNRELFEDGRPVELPPSPGLFLADQLAASARILDGAPPYVSEERILGVLELADALAC